MKVQPPAESFHRELSRPSLGLCVCFAYGENLCLCGCVSACLSPCLWRMFSHQAGRENPAFISVSQPAVFSPERVGSFSTSLRSRWRDVDVPWWPRQTKENMTWGRDTQQVDLPQCFRKIRHGRHDGAKSRSVYFHIHLMWKNNRNEPEEGFCIGLIKGMWFGIHRLSQPWENGHSVIFWSYKSPTKGQSKKPNQLDDLTKLAHHHRQAGGEEKGPTWRFAS